MHADCGHSSHGTAARYRAFVALVLRISPRKSAISASVIAAQMQQKAMFALPVLPSAVVSVLETQIRAMPANCNTPPSA